MTTKLNGTNSDKPAISLTEQNKIKKLVGIIGKEKVIALISLQKTDTQYMCIPDKYKGLSRSNVHILKTHLPYMKSHIYNIPSKVTTNWLEKEGLNAPVLACLHKLWNLTQNAKINNPFYSLLLLQTAANPLSKDIEKTINSTTCTPISVEKKENASLTLDLLSYYLYHIKNLNFCMLYSITGINKQNNTILDNPFSSQSINSQTLNDWFKSEMCTQLMQELQSKNTQYTGILCQYIGELLLFLTITQHNTLLSNLLTELGIPNTQITHFLTAYSEPVSKDIHNIIKDYVLKLHTIKELSQKYSTPEMYILKYIEWFGLDTNPMSVSNLPNNMCVDILEYYTSNRMTEKQVHFNLEELRYKVLQFATQKRKDELNECN